MITDLTYEEALYSLELEKNEPIEKTVTNNDNTQENKRVDSSHFDEDIDCDANTILLNRQLKFDLQPVHLTTSEDQSFKNNFFKGCKWAPDGSCIMSNSEDKIIRIYNMPSELWNSHILNNRNLSDSVKIKEVDSIFDFCWYPLMNTWNPQSCFLATTCRDSPIHLWNVCNKKVMNTLKSYNQSEELETAYSLAFSHDGLVLFAGLNKSILIYDTESSFSKYQRIPTHNKNFPSRGQHGIISCFGISSFHPNLFAAGAYSNSIGIYTRTNNALISLLHGSQGGITHLIFSSDGTKLFSGDERLCECYLGPIYNMLGPEKYGENKESKYMVSGLMNGDIIVWDLFETLDQNNSDSINDGACLKFKAHDDAVNGVSFHPILPILASVSGQRHVKCHNIQSGSSSEEDEVDQESGSLEKDISASGGDNKNSLNSIKLWWCGKR